MPVRARRNAAATNVQALGNVAASAVAGLLYTVASPTAAFCYLAAWMLVALAAVAWALAGRSASGTDPL